MNANFCFERIRESAEQISIADRIPDRLHSKIYSFIHLLFISARIVYYVINFEKSLKIKDRNYDIKN